MSESILELTDAAFDQAVNDSDVPVLVDFWAPWCGPCKMLTPIIEDIGTEYGDKIKTYKINTDDNRDSAIELGISAIPTLILFDKGRIEKKWVGLTSKKDIVAAIDQLLG